MSFRHRLFYLSKSMKYGLGLSMDLALLSSLAALVGYALSPRLGIVIWLSIGLAGAVISATCLDIAGVYHTVYKYWGLHEIRSYLAASSASSLIIGTIGYAAGQMGLALILFAGFLIASHLVLGMRLALRQVFVPLFVDEQRGSRPQRLKTLIYGAGEAGFQLATALATSNEFKASCFVDDSPNRWGKRILGIPIIAPDEAAAWIRDNSINAALVAIPSADRSRIAEIVRFLEPMGVLVRTLPGTQDLATGRVTISDLKEVTIEDLLGRPPVQPNQALMSCAIKDKVVMVTGAGGSIGSELCRQIVDQQPTRIILFELNEFALYSIEKDLRSRVVGHSKEGPSELEVVPILGSILDDTLLDTVMAEHGVQTIYHAAAYKHVPMVESQPIAGVLNNSFGTWRVLNAAIRNRAERFTLISTDKAVRPTNVMGATKRLAEMIVQAVSKVGPKACDLPADAPMPELSMVRFGNVLGSSGSVVPLFREQIRKGGPITLTHENVTRYFMTIPEASQLVIQAAAMGNKADVFLLDMGDPVLIRDLAIRMIRLSGLREKDDLNPDGDIEIRITGLRPGEKLYEELLIGDAASSTSHPRISRADEGFTPWSELVVQLNALYSASADQRSQDISSILNQIVEGYTPKSGRTDGPECGPMKPTRKSSSWRAVRH